MNGPLDRLVDNLTCNFCNTKCKHYMKCKDCKKCKTCDEIVKLVQNYQIVVKIATRYMNTVDVFLNIWK